MPIFEKDGRRVYFAHIPKTAGIAIYVTLIEGGWTISNVQSGDFPGSTANILRERFGIDKVPNRGRKFRFRGPMQHAPAIVWRFWGPFDASFAVVRHPLARMKSSLRYLHALGHTDKPFDDFVRETMDLARSDPDKIIRNQGIHFRRQSDFVRRSTRIFRFEDDWQGGIARMMGLPVRDMERINASVSRPIPLIPEDIAWACKTYARDYRSFGYDRM